jgi:hypothetical protein
MTDHPIPAQARDLTDQEQAARAEACYGIEQRIKQSIRTGREATWQLAQALYEFDEESGWLALGYEDLTHWLAEPDIGMKRSHYYRFITTWRELVVRRQVTAEQLMSLDVSKVDIVLPALKRGDVKLNKALDDAEQLGQRDLRDIYIGQRSDESTETRRNGKADEVEPPEDVPSASTATADLDENASEPDTEVLPPVPDLEDADVLAYQLAAFVQELSDAKFWQPEAKKVPAEWRERAAQMVQLAKDHGVI